ncbi:MAG: hypothetical protein IPP60_06000 [Sphingobacteriales bacterium]|nr:hypothetical protein [Sphingobacteriales bacterium]
MEKYEYGYYGQFGGAYIFKYPSECRRITAALLECVTNKDFKGVSVFVKDYVGRPTPLYFCQAAIWAFQNTIYLKRENLCHTGAHKINNTRLDRFYWQNDLVKRVLRNRCRTTWRGYSNGCALMNYMCGMYG